MPSMYVVRSISIDSNPKHLFSVLSNLSTWKDWSPWLIMEPGVQVNVSEDKKYYDWEGKRVGAGNMKITNEEENRFVEYDLNFLKPWKSEAKVRFEISPEENGSKVSWHMDSSVPWFMFWMKGMMEGFVSMDFDRGLNLLKDYMEYGELHSKLDFKGKQHFPGSQYIGIKKTCSFRDLGEVMSADFGTLMEFVSGYRELLNDQSFAIYHKWNISRKEASFTCCAGVTSIPDNIPSDFISGEIPECDMYVLRHQGPYHHLGNAWSTLNSMSRGKEFSHNKKIDPFEVYMNNPKETEPRDLITDVCFPLK